MVADNFGELNGESITNKNTIMNEIDIALGKNSSPCVEYIITYAYGIIRLPFNLGSINYNPFGHSVLRYRTPDGIDRIVNIEAKDKFKPFIRFYEPKEYFYGTNSETCGAQRGVYNRSMIGLRIENVDPKDIELMHNYILKLLDDDTNQKIKFNIIFGPILNILGSLFNNTIIKEFIPEYGNCSKWMSSILLKGNLITGINVWPKTVFINLFENYEKTNIKTKSNMNIVYYQQPSHIRNLTFGIKNYEPVWFENIAPFQSIRNYFYGNFKHFANCIVHIPSNSMQAQITINPTPYQPSQYRNYLNNKYFIITSVCASIIIYKKSASYTFNKIKNLIK